MRRFALVTLCLAVMATTAHAQPEREAQIALCAGLRIEVRLGDQMRADCVSATHAIEVEFSDKWKEGIGQALAYGAAAALRPGLILICRRDEAECLKSSLGARETLSSLDVASTLWDCAADAADLAECPRWELGGD